MKAKLASSDSRAQKEKAGIGYRVFPVWRRDKKYTLRTIFSL
jgi:hypothetical protein